MELQPGTRFEASDGLRRSSISNSPWFFSLKSRCSISSVPIASRKVSVVALAQGFISLFWTKIRTGARSRPLCELSRPKILLTLSLALIAFAANSILCRLALSGRDIEAGMFTTIRLLSGALLLLVIAPRDGLHFERRSWLSAGMLFAYAACFSFAYVQLSAGVGALLLFGAVQLTMLLGSFIGGERLGLQAILGWFIACAGLIYLLLPGALPARALSAALMISAGIAWGIYSLLGKRNVDPVAATAKNFVLASAMTAVLFATTLNMEGPPTLNGVALAAASGVLTSGLGYVIWYRALKSISSATAAVAQLTVPIIAAVGGIIFLSESLTMQLAIAAFLTLGGVALSLRMTLLRKTAT